MVMPPTSGGPPRPVGTFEDVYISAASNRYSHAADWALIELAGSDRASVSVLAYASHKSIAIVENPENDRFRTIATLISTPSKGPLTVIKFSASNSAGSPDLVVGSSDGSTYIFRAAATGHDTRRFDWRLLCSVKGHTGSISAIGVLRTSPSQSSTSLVCTGASDGKVCVWLLSDAETSTSNASYNAQLLHTITPAALKGALPLDMALIRLSSSSSAGSTALLALATTDRKLQLWALGEESTAETSNASRVCVVDGHEDWIRSLDFCISESTESSNPKSPVIMLASGAQDNCVRLWSLRRISSRKMVSAQVGVVSSLQPDETPRDDFEALAEKLEMEAKQNDKGIANKAHTFWVRPADGVVEDCWSIVFDALLVGHDAWVTGVRWHQPVLRESGKWQQPAALLSSSSDNSLIIWRPDIFTESGAETHRIGPFPSFQSEGAATSLWTPSFRFGEIGGTGAASLGFFGCLWSPAREARSSVDEAAKYVLAHDWAGATHLWSRDANESALSMQYKWSPQYSFTGHYGHVKDVQWEPHGDYFLSAGLDRTTRLHAPWRRESETQITWHEIARPQTHGYDMSAVSWLSRTSFVSAADEKILRLFSAPQGFINNARALKSFRSEEQDDPLQPFLRNDTVNILAFSIRDLTQLRHPDFLVDPIRAATSATSQSLRILISSPLFEGFADQTSSAEVREVSFRDIESFLKWTYAQAWSVAIEESRLLLNVDIVFTAESHASSALERVAMAGGPKLERIFTIRGSSHAFPYLELPSSPLAAVTQLTASPSELKKGQSPSDAAFKRHPAIALGGTFDHLHVGHKILLSIAALIATQKIIVGVTGDSMLAKKSNGHLLEPLDVRLRAVSSFLTLFRMPLGPLQYDVVELADVCGPAGTEVDLQAMLVTEETAAGGDMIADTRKERGLPELVRYTIGVIGAQGETEVKGKDAKELAAGKIGSTAIRKWIAEQEEQGKNVSRAHKSSQQLQGLAIGASVPPLGLSNRAIRDGEFSAEAPGPSGFDLGASNQSKTSTLQAAPTEEYLNSSTLWPEIEKLYGHGYELLSVSASPDGRLVASTCKSTVADHAIVRVHDRDANWKECAQLGGHTLSITRVLFSPDGHFVLTASRDRTWRIFRVRLAVRADGEVASTGHQKAKGEVEFEAVGGEMAHARIVWDCAWGGTVGDGASHRLFATASRDKALKVWKLDLQAQPAQTGKDNSKPYILLATLKHSEAVTAVAFGPHSLLAAGFESGSVQVYQPTNSDLDQWAVAYSLPTHHTDAVSRLAFQPTSGVEDDAAPLLLSGGTDHAVRLVRLEAPPKSVKSAL